MDLEDTIKITIATIGIVAVVGISFNFPSCNLYGINPTKKCMQRYENIFGKDMSTNKREDLKKYCNRYDQ